MFSKRKFLLISKINILIIILLLIIKIMPVTLSKYQSSGIGNMNSNIAFYLISADYLTQNIKLTDLTPSDEAYVYTFTIGNKKEEEISEVDIEYTLSIVTTTNLPLRYELYENTNYQEEGSVNLISTTNTVVSPDSDGTYFQNFTFEKEELYYQTPITNTYTLVIYFDQTNNDAKYQDVVEGIQIIVDSRQIIEENS
ncbi:MAG: hypothetical protein MR598_02350 [Erysipelotrichaceae bacterium]|nr:hypothetical protein [Erysipelotrichaceae bacterium]